MRILITCLSLLFLSAYGKVQAQASKDATVPLSASVSLAPASITLSWANPAPSNILILRRTKGQAGNQWVQVLNVTNSSQTTLTDNTLLTLGQTYEYVIQRTTTINAFGYVHVALRAPVVDNRGKVLVFVDSTTADALGVELVRMKNDMRGDGWIAVPYKVGPFATPASVKAQIVADYTADPQNIKAVLLLGDVPIPYSGNANWDGHDDHQGAWPADSYYGDVNGVWTDASIDNVTPGRDANDNIPGDGKFDQSYLPSAIELPVGRVDFRRINAPAFGETDAIGLMRRYLDKNHAWRIGAYTVENKALIDDNFGYFGGEAFAANGYRNAYPLVGEANIVEADFFTNTNPQRWLLGYGCGGGWYQGASGVGSSADFAVDTVNIVFSNLFGSYHGDWDYEADPFMPAALASRGGILTCSWAGRPHWFNQALASGETIGYCHKETQNAQFNNGFFQSIVGESGAHTALLGDPTLRAHIVPPPANVTISSACVGVNIAWEASPDAVDGYHVYRSLSNDGPYARISSNLVNATTFVDNNPILDTLYYQIRAIKTQISPGGGIYLNNSVGPIVSLIYTPSTPPEVVVQGGTLTCGDPVIGLDVTSNTPLTNWAWSGPLGVTSSDTVFQISIAGNYSVVVTDVNGCTAEGAIFVDQNTIPPVVNVVSSGLLTCENLTATLSVTSSSPLDQNTFVWSTGATTPTVSVDQPLDYTVTVNSLDNGCEGTATLTLAQDVTPPNVDFPNLVTYNCINNCISLALPNPNAYTYFLDLVPIPSGDPLTLCNAGTFSILTVSNSNGCSVEHPITVASDVNEPGASIGGSGQLTCLNTSVQLMGGTSAADVTFLWSGPGINASNENQQNPTVSAPGTYTLVVTDNLNGCTSSDTFDVASDGSVPIISVTGGAITCLNTSVVLTSTSNIANSTFLWSGPGGFSSTDQNPLTTFPGSYTVVVTAPNNCSATGAVEVLDQAQAPEFLIPSIPTLTCAIPCVTVELIPLTPGLIINPISICIPGDYEFTITGANGCSAIAAFTVTQDDPFSAAIEPAFLDCDGSATLSVVAVGGTQPYTYLWSNGSTFSSALFIVDGTPISVTVSDAGGCVWVSAPITIVPAPPINISSTIIGELAGQSNGAINLEVAGGTPPFGFSWSNGANTQNLSGITAGIYTVTITEFNTGCTTEASFTVLSIVVGTDEASLLRTFELSPNPTSGISTLSIQLQDQMPVKIEIRDALGRLIQDNPTVVASELVIPIDLTHQAAGIYHITVVVDNQVFVRKLVVVK